MKRNPFLPTAITTAIITSLLLTSCQSGRTTSTDNPDSNVQNSSVSEAESKADNSETKKSLRTVTEIPSGELSDTDKFLSGTWIDENGFVANFTDKGRTAIFDELDIIEISDRTSDNSSDEEIKKACITAKDADTIEISCDGIHYTAYHVYSVKGQELAENFENSVIGEWVTCNTTYWQTINIKKYNFLSMLKSESGDDAYTVGLDGVKLRSALLEDTNAFVRLAGEKLKLYNVYGKYISSVELVRKDSDEYNELTDAGSAINGVWVDPDDLDTTLTFFAGNSLTVTGNAFKEVLGEKFDSLSGKAYDISARYTSDIINVYSGDDTLFSIVMYGSDILAVFADSNDRYPRILF